MESLRDAWPHFADASTGRVPAERVAALLTRAGWASRPTQTTYCVGRGVVRVSHATDNDVVGLLRHCGFSSRAIGAGGLSVSLSQVEPWWRVQVLGTRAPPNPALTRAVIGGASLFVVWSRTAIPAAPGPLFPPPPPFPVAFQ
jgi:hypothetical protein